MSDTKTKTKVHTAAETRTRAEQVARDYFEAVAARDTDLMATFWDPDGVEDIVPLGILRGPGEVKALFDETFAALPDSEMIVDSVIGDERIAAVQWRLSGTFSGGSFQGIDPTGRRIELRGCDCVEIREDGKIVRNTVYYDAMEFARAVGMMPPMDSAAERAMKTAFNGATRLRNAIRNR